MLEHDGSPEGDANARLIAAAPDLLEALKGVLALLDGGAPAYDLRAKAENLRALIYQAEVAP